MGATDRTRAGSLSESFGKTKSYRYPAPGKGPRHRRCLWPIAFANRTRVGWCPSTAGVAAGNEALIIPLMPEQKLDTNLKAQRINLDAGRYGTFAEIGARQEVARWIFRAGGAAGTGAKTISAYDRAARHATYGATDHQVGLHRIRAER